MKKFVFGSLLVLMMVFLCACGGKEEDKPDYASAEELEYDLALGYKVIDKTAQFTVDSIHPGKDGGFNLWAGQHLNFISRAEEAPCEEGETLTVRITEVNREEASWFLEFEIVE